MRKAIFLDRDGVINKGMDRLVSPEQFELLPGVAEAIRKINDSGYLVIIVTNQPDISKGFLSFSALEEMHKKLVQELHKEGARIDAIYVCPHHPEKGFPGEVSELKIICDCRKPRPGMIIQAIKDHRIDKNGSWLVGDSKADILAGQAAGLKTILVTESGGSTSRQEKELQCKPDYTKPNLSGAVRLILSF